MALYVLIFIAMTILMVPTTFLNLGGACIFAKYTSQLEAFFLTSFLVIFSTLVGGVIGFWIGRNLIRNWIRKHLTRKIKIFRAMDLGLKHNGFKMVVLMRTVVPHNIIHYLMSVTSLRIKDFILGSLVGMIPNTVIQVYIGSKLKSIDDILTGNYGFGPWQPVIVTIGIVLFLVVTSLMVSYSKEELGKLV